MTASWSTDEIMTIATSKYKSAAVVPVRPFRSVQLDFLCSH